MASSFDDVEGREYPTAPCHTTCCGGRASDDAIRSLVISYKLFGTRECSRSPHRLRDGALHEYIDWLTIGVAEGSIVEDVTRIRAHPLVPGRIPVYGHLHDVKTGKLIEIPAATVAGRPK